MTQAYQQAFRHLFDGSIEEYDPWVLHAVPIPEAMSYLMLRPLMDDVADDDMCGVTTNQVFPVNEKWHPLLMEALSCIPDVQAGDSVWWHCERTGWRQSAAWPSQAESTISGTRHLAQNQGRS